jgi:hypothetical protein
MPALSRGLSELRLRQFRASQRTGVPIEETNASLGAFDEFATAFSDSATDINGLVSDLGEQATALKEQLFARAELIAQRDALQRRGAQAEAAALVIPEVDRATAMTVLATGTPGIRGSFREVNGRPEPVNGDAPPFADAGVQQAFEKWKGACAISSAPSRRRSNGFATGPPMRRCRGIARSARSFSARTGSRRAFGRIGMAFARCSSARFSCRWSR